MLRGFQLLKMENLQLHAHLSGSISRECLHQIWVQKKAQGQTALEDPLTEMPVGKFDYNLET
jgi:adenosine deaminase